MYTFHSKVRYSETAEDGRLSLHSVVNYFQDCSIFQSESLGLGVEALKQAHHAWLMNSWQVVLTNRPVLGEEIAISTWAYDFKGCYGYRNFLIQDNSGSDLAFANSIWVYFDTQTGRPSRCSKEAVSVYPIEPAYPMEPAPRKITIPEGLIALPAFPVRPSDLDTNHHVNNGSYIRMASDLLEADLRAGQMADLTTEPHLPYYNQMRAEYRSQTVLGDTIFPSIAHSFTPEGEECYTVVLADREQNIHCIVEFKGEFL